MVDQKGAGDETVLERCAALDVHKKQVTACARILGEGGELEELTVEFSTMAADLLALRDWLKQLGVTHVAMEATGVYWKPVYYALEDDFELVAGQRPARQERPRAQDRHAATRSGSVSSWSAGCCARASCRPKPIRELRDLTRYRKSLIRERAREANRLHKVLEDAGIKLSCVASDVLGVSGRLMLDALLSRHARSGGAGRAGARVRCARSSPRSSRRSPGRSSPTTR